MWQRNEPERAGTDERIVERHTMSIKLLPAMALLLLAAPAGAAALDPPTQQQLLGIFDSYDKTIVTGNLDAAMPLMSKQLRAHAKANIKTAADRKEAMEMARMMVPDTMEVVHSFIDKAGTHARIVTVASKTVPKDQPPDPDGPPPGSIVRNGMTLSFVKEGGAWKFDEQLFGADPTTIVGCKSEVADPASSYDPEKSVSAGGPIVRVDFKPEYTLVVFTVVFEASCAFLPAKPNLAKLGIDPDQLVPYAIVSLDGIAHRTDPQKMLADKAEIHPEE
jgi:hypothetical protein